MAFAARSSRTRHIKHRITSRVRKLRRFRQWLETESTRLTGTETPTVFTAPASGSVFTAVAHGFGPGEGPYRPTVAAGTLPTGMDQGQRLYVEPIDADTFRLRVGQRRESSKLLVVSDAGSGTLSLTKVPSRGGILSINRNNRPVEIENAADIDDLR